MVMMTNRNRSSKTLSLLANIICLTALLPYVSPIPFPYTDIQFMGTVAAVLVLLIILVLNPELLSVTKTDIIVFLLGIFSLVYVDWGQTGFNLEWLRRTGAILQGFPVYYAVRNLYKYMSPWVFISLLVSYLVALVLQLINPSLFEAIFSHFMSAIRYLPGLLGRGPGGLALEPSQMALLASFFIIAPLVLKREYWETNRLWHRIVIFASVLMLIITRSATSIGIGIVILLIWILVSKRSLVLKTALIGGLLSLLFIARMVDQPAQYDRRLDYVINVARDLTFAFRDPSAAARIAGTAATFVNLAEIPLGTGSISLNYTLIASAWESPLIDLLILPEYEDYVWWYTTQLGIGDLGRGIQRMGLFYLVIFGILIMLIQAPQEKLLFRVMFVAFTLNGTIGMSVIWFMLGCCTGSDLKQVHMSIKRRY